MVNWEKIVRLAENKKRKNNSKEKAGIKIKLAKPSRVTLKEQRKFSVNGDLIKLSLTLDEWWFFWGVKCIYHVQNVRNLGYNAT